MKLGLILGDQLSMSLATLTTLDRDTDRLVMAEVHAEATYVRHHKQKIAFLFSAMRHFAASLEQSGWQVDYYTYGEHAHSDLLDVLQDQCQHHPAISDIVITHCGEYRLQSAIDNGWAKQLPCPLTVLADDRFICSPDRFAQWAKGRKQLRMEFFYRDMRKQTGLLMDNGEPMGGAWNFDASNRNAYKGEVPLPPPLRFARDDTDKQVLALVARHFTDHMGSLDDFFWGTTREQAQQALSHFIDHRLPYFGDYQDALVRGEDTLFHSLLSPYINAGLLDPLEACRAAEQAYFAGTAPLNAVEGFIRQIIGWREYVRGIYWLMMPNYAEGNGLGNSRDLPGYYWHGETHMLCMSEALRNTHQHAYAHHIQRLMITGNFALLAGVLPDAVCQWYLEAYADAYEWVELPNTLGMVMHADGGYLGSKPYAASGNYINKMSNYCKQCRYNVKTSSEDDSCPFNSLYWHFIARHREQFRSNPRMAMIYRSMDRMAPEKINATLAHADGLLTRLDSL